MTEGNIGRVGHHQQRLDAAEHALDVRRDRAVAAEETMPPEQPQIAPDAREPPARRPGLDLVRRPRPLIFAAISRAGARTRDGGEVWALLRAGRPAPGRAPPRAIDYSYD